MEPARQNRPPSAMLFPENTPALDGPCPILEGKLPEDLRGVLYQNRPGGFRRGNFHYRHWLDGDGLVSALWLAPHGAWFRCRYVETRKRREEEAAGAALYRSFGTAFPGDRLKMGVALESPANIHAIPWDGRLLATAEQGLPYAVDLRTLATLGEWNGEGTLSPLSPFSAHGKVHGGEFLNFGVEYHPTRARLRLYAFGSRLRTGVLNLDGPRAPHDFLVTPRHLVFHLPPHFFEMGPLTSGKAAAECYAWRPERGVKLWLVDRQDLRGLREFPLEGGYVLHMVNAFESEDATVVDVLEYDQPLYHGLYFDRLNRGPLPGRLVRYRLSTGGCHREFLSAYDRMPDFPAIDPAAFGEREVAVWGLGSSVFRLEGEKFYDELWSWKGGQTEVFRLTEGAWFSGDPVSAAGYRLVFVAAPEGSQIWIFSKDGPTRGPLCRLALPGSVPAAVHGTFVSDSLTPPTPRP